MQEVQETQVWCLGWDDPLEKQMATHPYSDLEIPWTEEPGRLQTMGSQKRQTLATRTTTMKRMELTYKLTKGQSDDFLTDPDKQE